MKYLPHIAIFFCKKKQNVHENIFWEILMIFMQLICICLADFRSMAAKIAATKKKEKIASFISNEGMYALTR